MITNLEYFNGKVLIHCALLELVGDNALISIRNKNGLAGKLKVKFDTIRISKDNSLPPSAVANNLVLEDR